MVKKVYVGQTRTERQQIIISILVTSLLQQPDKMTVLTPSLICTVAAVQRQCYLMCGFIQQMWVNCAFSHFALSHYKNSFITSSGTGSGSGPRVERH